MSSIGYNRATKEMKTMRIFVCAITILVIATTVFSQTNNQTTSIKTYMVMGIDCNSNVNDVIEKFKKIGFDIVSPIEKNYVLESSEQSLSKIVIYIANDRIDHIQLFQYYGPKYAYYPNWSALKNAIIELGNKFAKEYNVLHVNRFEFTEPYKEGDGKEFNAICNSNAAVFSYMETFNQESDLAAIKIRTSKADPNKIYIVTDFWRTENLNKK